MLLLPIFATKKNKAKKSQLIDIDNEKDINCLPIGNCLFAECLCTVSNTQRNGHAQFLDALTLADGSTFNGCIGGNITNAAGERVSTETGTVHVTLGDDCTWTLTADTYITSLKGDAGRIKTNGHRLFVDGSEMTNE